MQDDLDEIVGVVEEIAQHAGAAGEQMTEHLAYQEVGIVLADGLNSPSFEAQFEPEAGIEQVLAFPAAGDSPDVGGHGIALVLGPQKVEGEVSPRGLDNLRFAGFDLAGAPDPFLGNLFSLLEVDVLVGFKKLIGFDWHDFNAEKLLEVAGVTFVVIGREGLVDISAVIDAGDDLVRLVLHHQDSCLLQLDHHLNEPDLVDQVLEHRFPDRWRREVPAVQLGRQDSPIRVVCSVLEDVVLFIGLAGGKQVIRMGVHELEQIVDHNGRQSREGQAVVSRHPANDQDAIVFPGVILHFVITGRGRALPPDEVDASACGLEVPDNLVMRHEARWGASRAGAAAPARGEDREDFDRSALGKRGAQRERDQCEQERHGFHEV